MRYIDSALHRAGFRWALCILIAGCVSDPRQGACRQSVQNAEDGGWPASGFCAEDLRLKPPVAPADGGCSCPVAVTCGGAGETGNAAAGEEMDGGANPVPDSGASGSGSSLGQGDEDDGSVAGGGQATDSGSGTAGFPTPSEPGELVINEIMADPTALTDSAGEWVELYHPGPDSSLDLRGCEISDGDGAEGLIESEIVLGPGGFAVLAKSADSGFQPDYVCPGLSLKNSGGDEVILRCNGVEIDRAVYTAAKAGSSLSLDPARADAQANDDPSAWCASETSYNGDDRGTPMAANPPCGQ